MSKVTSKSPPPPAASCSAPAAPHRGATSEGARAEARPADRFSGAGSPPAACTARPAHEPHVATSDRGVGFETRPAGGLPPIKHAFVIMMENQDWSHVKGNPKAAFINQVVLPQASYADNYRVGHHPSEPNYIELEAGSTLGIGDDGTPQKNHQSTHDHLTRLMTDAGISWKSYQEDISGKKVPLKPEGHYQPKHNPNVFFDDNTGNGNPNDPFGIAHNRPYTELAKDLKAGNAPQFSFITPNMIHDGHDSAPPLRDGVAQSDAWLRQELPKIMASDAYKDHGAIFIVWDEGKSGANNPSGMILLSPDAKGGGYHNDVAYSHASTLKTVEELFGLKKLLGDAATATDLGDLFKPQTAPEPPPPPAPRPPGKKA